MEEERPADEARQNDEARQGTEVPDQQDERAVSEERPSSEEPTAVSETPADQPTIVSKADRGRPSDQNPAGATKVSKRPKDDDNNEGGTDTAETDNVEPSATTIVSDRPKEEPTGEDAADVEGASAEPAETTIVSKKPDDSGVVEDEPEAAVEGVADNVEVEKAGLSTRHTRLIIGGIVVVVILIIFGLFLPPISLGERLGISDGSEPQEADSASGELTAGDSFSLAVTGTEKRVRVDSVAQQEFLNGEAGEDWQPASDALPADLILVSDLYTIEYNGDDGPLGKAEIIIPAAAQPYQTLDLYEWDGEGWHFVPSQIGDNGGRLASGERGLPLAYALMQTTPPPNPAIGAEVLPAHSLPVAVLPLLTEVTAGTLTLTEGGILRGEIVSVPTGGYRQLIRATNTGAIVDSVTLSAMLNDPAAQNKNIADLLEQVQAGDYDGVNLDYQGVDAGLTEAFTAFVADLAEQLASAGRSLVITLETPVEDGGVLDTGGQDWQSLGQIADSVYVQMPLEPTAYGDGGEAQRIAEWATREVDRRKLTMLVSVNAVDAVGDARRELESGEALANFGELQFVKGADEVEPGTAIEVALSGSAGDLAWDPDSLTYKYTYEQAGQAHDVWLGSDAVLLHRARFGNVLNLRGLAVRGLGTLDKADGYAAALGGYLGSSDAPQPASAAIVWAVENPDGGVVASSSGESLTYTWEAPEEPGEYTIVANFAQGDSVAHLGSLPVSVAAPPTPTPEPTATPEEEEEPTATPVAVAAAVDPGSADAVANTDANVRNGPGLAYGIIGGIRRGETATLIGRNEDSSWLQVRLADADDTEGWVFASLLSVNDAVNVGALAVVEVDPPAGAVASGGDGGGGAAPPPPVAAGGAFGAFELGGQTTGGLGAAATMSRAGMNWIKVQGHHGQDLSGAIATAHGAGFKILISVIGDKGKVMNDGYQSDYAAYVGQLAAQGADGIEIWNEANIDREWPTNQIDPAAYTRLLAKSFNAIKSNNGATLVISGAPAPTGAEAAFPGRVMNDDNWLRGVVNSGGVNYMDCVGIHYNEGTSSPTTYGGSAQGDNYYTRYYSGMVNTYANITGGARPLCFTELGFLSPEGYGSLPGNFAWASGTSVAEHAQWLGEAVRLARSSGAVRLMIIFNVDFTQWLPTDPQAGYAIIRPGGGCPACDTMGAAMGGG